MIKSVCLRGKKNYLEIIWIKDYSEQDLHVTLFSLGMKAHETWVNLGYRIKKIIKVRLNLIETMLAATFSYTKDTKKPPLLSHISPMEGSLTLKFEIF